VERRVLSADAILRICRIAGNFCRYWYWPRMLVTGMLSHRPSA